VFSTEVAGSFPRIKMLSWFEVCKFESEVGTTLDCTVTFNPVLIRACLDELPLSRLLFATDLPGFSPEEGTNG